MTANELVEKYHSIVERLDWSLFRCPDDKEVELRWYTPAGEDFGFCVSVDNFANDIREYANGFDREEHVTGWLDAKRSGVAGVPSVEELVEDALAIQNMLEELAFRVEHAVVELRTVPCEDNGYCEWFKTDLDTVLDVLEGLDSRNNDEGVSLRTFLDNYVCDEADAVYRFAKKKEKITEEGIAK